MVPCLVKSCRLHTRVNQTKKVRFSILILNDLHNFILKQTLPDVEPKCSLILASPGVHIGSYVYVITILKTFSIKFLNSKKSTIRFTVPPNMSNFTFLLPYQKNYKKIYYYCGVKFYFSKSKTCMGN